MELDKAIKVLIAQEGAEILNNSLLVNHLMDLQAFETMPASKYILKMMHSEGSLQKIYASFQSTGDPSILLKQISVEMIGKWGFQHDVVDYTVRNIALALNWNLPNAGGIRKENKRSQKETGKHFCFKNIEIGGDIEDVLNELQKLGYNVVGRDRNVAFLNGPFAGERECGIVVSVSDFIDEVESIMVMLPEDFTWWSLKGTYEKFKEKLTKKYGHPESIEQFYEPYCEGDGYELTALDSHNAFYSSKFIADKGYVRITIGPNPYRVFISYIDTLNETRIEEKRNSIADFDL